MKKELFTYLFAALGTSVSVNAAAVIHEPFDYGTGDLDGASSVTTGLSAWNASAAGENVVAQNFNYGILDNEGNQISTANNVGGPGARGNATTTVLSSAGLLNNGAELWFSIVTTGASGSNAHSGFGFGTAPIAGNFDGITMSGGDGFGLHFRQGNVRPTTFIGGARTYGTNISSSSGQTNLLVGRIDWGATAGDAEMITLYNVDENGLVLPGSSSSISVAAFNQAALNTISFASRSNAQSFDEIRFGGSFADVTPIPEPSSSALLALGGLALVLRRRK